MWVEASAVPAQMWAGRAQSQCRCGRGEPSSRVIRAALAAALGRRQELRRRRVLPRDVGRVLRMLRRRHGVLRAARLPESCTVRTPRTPFPLASGTVPLAPVPSAPVTIGPRGPFPRVSGRPLSLSEAQVYCQVPAADAHPPAGVGESWRPVRAPHNRDGGGYRPPVGLRLGEVCGAIGIARTRITAPILSLCFFK